MARKYGRFGRTALIERRPSWYRKYTMKPRAAEADLCCPPEKQKADLRPIEGDEADEELSTLAKALGHPARVKILRILVRKNACICGDIVEELPLAQSTVSQHLKVLKDAGLIRGDVDGPRVCYCIEQRALRRLKALVGGL
jgi:ArsR family transcriptional regulator